MDRPGRPRASAQQQWQERGSGGAAGEYGSFANNALGTINSLSKMTDRIDCTFAIVAAALDIANTGGDVTGTVVGNVWEGCGALGASYLPPLPTAVGCPLLSLNSFVGDTPVETPSGMMPIQWLRVGDKVVSRNEATGVTEAQVITDLIKHVDEGVLWLTLRKVPDGRAALLQVGDGGAEALGVTPGHPFHVAARGWVLAHDLKPGDILDARDGKLEVVSTKLDATPRVVYNLSVGNDASYFVGTDRAWVHNATLNQIAKWIWRGKAPRGVLRLDKGKPPHELPHIHIDNCGALNIDGTWKHGGGPIPKTIRNWLVDIGWTLP